MATKVLMVIAVGITGRWRIPLAYCLTDGTNAELQESLLQLVISKLWESQCLVISVTMDGLSANQKTLRNLGCCLDPTNLISSFPHPLCADIQIAAIFDACHMMKLARNCLAEYRVIRIPGSGNVKWKHIEDLHKEQQNEGLNLANKLSSAHVNFKTQKMKVKLAVQVISSSCASALQFLRNCGLPQFLDTAPTEYFLRRLDQLFDYLNCRSLYGKGYKSPVTVSNAVYRMQFLEDTKKLLLELEDSSGIRLVFTKRRMFVIGLCISIDSVIHMIKQLILSDGLNGIKLQYMLTYKFSQDHIETMFGIVRQRGGWSNNPSALQFST